MKRLLAGLCAIVLVLLPAPPAWALQYEDADRTTTNDDARAYHNLESVSWPESAQMHAQDRTLLQLRASSGMQQGWVRYRVSGAEEISVRIVTQVGTFFTVHQSGSSCNFGAYNGMPSGLYEMHTMLIDPADGSLYADTPLGWQQLTIIRGTIRVLQAGNPPDTGRLVNFGLNVYAMSSETDSGTLVSMRRTAADITYNSFDSNIACAEEFTSSNLPAGTQYLRVEINDMQPELQTDATVRTSISHVRISGDQLVVGEPEPDPGPEPGDGDGTGEGEGDGNGNGNGDGEGDGDGDGETGNGDNTGNGNGSGGASGSSRSSGSDAVYRYRVSAGGDAFVIRESVPVAADAEAPPAPQAAEWPSHIVGAYERAIPLEARLFEADDMTVDGLLSAFPEISIEEAERIVGAATASADMQMAGGHIVYELTGESGGEAAAWKDLIAYAYIGAVSVLLLVWLLRSKRHYK